MLMCKKHINVAITLSIILFVFVFLAVIAYYDFFTKDNDLEYTIEKADINNEINEIISENQVIENTYTQTSILYLNETKVATSLRDSNNNSLIKNNTILDDVNNEETELDNSESSVINSNTEVSEEVIIDNVESNIPEKVESNVSTPQVSNPVVTTSETPKPVSQSNYPASIGKVEIPKSGVNITLFKEMSLEGMNLGACLLFSTGSVNYSGNSLILAHNYSNFFGNNKNLNIGDKIYVTTSDGKRVEYTVYNKFYESPENVDFVLNDTNGKPEITLSTCTSDDNLRLIIQAKIS